LCSSERGRFSRFTCLRPIVPPKTAANGVKQEPRKVDKQQYSISPYDRRSQDHTCDRQPSDLLPDPDEDAGDANDARQGKPSEYRRDRNHGEHAFSYSLRNSHKRDGYQHLQPASLSNSLISASTRPQVVIRVHSASPGLNSSLRRPLWLGLQPCTRCLRIQLP